MNELRILLKIALFTICYALLYYWFPLPQLAFLGFLFPLAYIYTDMEKVKHIQVQLAIGFGGGIVLGIIVIKLALWGAYFGFVSMSALVILSFYLSCFQTWLKLSLIIIAALVAMSFNLSISANVLLTASVFEKLILGIFISIVLYGVIDFILGDRQHEYLPKIVFCHFSKKFKAWNWLHVSCTLCLYISVLCIIGLQKTANISPAISAIATGTSVIVLSGSQQLTKHNIRLRITGAIVGVVIGILQLMLLVVLPFFFIQIALLVLLLGLAAHFILRFANAAKMLPQAAVTYLTIVAMGAHIDPGIDSAFLRLAGILLGVIVVYIVGIFFLPNSNAAQAPH